MIIFIVLIRWSVLGWLRKMGLMLVRLVHVGFIIRFISLSMRFCLCFIIWIFCKILIILVTFFSLLFELGPVSSTIGLIRILGFWGSWLFVSIALLIKVKVSLLSILFSTHILIQVFTHFHSTSISNTWSIRSNLSNTILLDIFHTFRIVDVPLPMVTFYVTQKWVTSTDIFLDQS